MDNHQWRLSQAYTYAYSYNFNYLSITYTLPIACHSLSVHTLCLWHIFYLYFLYIPISSTLHIPIHVTCSSFTLVICLFNVPILLQVTYHASSLCLFHLSVLGLIAFYVLFIYFTYICTFLFYHIPCAFVYFCTFLMLAYSQYFHIISLFFVSREFLSHLSYLP